MSDARWTDVAADFAAACEHFRNAVALYELGGFDAPGLDGYAARMAFMHAMLAAHTSFEGGLVRILETIGEKKPVGLWTLEASAGTRSARSLDEAQRNPGHGIGRRETKP